jgi:hypothetical protein
MIYSFVTQSRCVKAREQLPAFLLEIWGGSPPKRGRFTTIHGTLNSTPSTRLKKRTFIIQFFSSSVADPSGYGEGQTFLGQTQVKTDKQGNAGLFGFAPASKVSVGRYITATATNKATGDTSDSGIHKY